MLHDPDDHVWNMGQGDTLPVLEEQLRNGDGTVIDLTNALTVEVVIRYSLDATAFTRTGTVVDGELTNGTAVTPADGWVTFDWATGDTDVAGRWLRKWYVTFNSGRKISVPNAERGYPIEVTKKVEAT